MADHVLLFVTSTYTRDMISGHRREGKIYDLIEVMMAKKLREESKLNLVGERN